MYFKGLTLYVYFRALQEDDKVIEEVESENMARNAGARIPYNNYQPLSVVSIYFK